MSESPAAKNLKITETQKLSRQDILFSLARRPGSEKIFAGSSDGQVHEIDLAAEKPEAGATPLAGEHQHRAGSYVTGLALAAGGKRLISGAYDGRLIWWDADSRQSMRAVEAHAKWIRGVVASPDGTLVASVADDMVARLWNAENGELVGELHGHETQTPHHYPSMLFTCAFSPDGRHLATADKVGHIVIWELASQKQVTRLEASTMYTWDPERRRHSIGGVRSLAFSADGKMLAAGGMGEVGNIDHLGGKARVRLFDWQKGATLAEIETSEIKGLVERLAFHPRGDWLLGSGGDHKGFAILIDPATGKTILEQKTPAFHVHDFALDDAAEGFVAVGHNGLAQQAIGPAKEA